MMEMKKCKASAPYFIANYVKILNASEEGWVSFELWDAQIAVLKKMHKKQRVAILKARQLGLTWLALGYILWRMVFYPIATVGIFSRTEDDAKELLDKRLKGMYERLPDFMRETPKEDNKTIWQIGNGSTAMAFATNGGRQYTFSIAMVDEADYQPDLSLLLTAVEPTIDAGGKMWLISSANKDEPESRFKSLYHVAREGQNEWLPIFLPWHARPSRTEEWYQAQRAKCLAETGAYDDIAAEYPATDTEALAPRSLDKRIASTWIEACYGEQRALMPGQAPALPGLVIWAEPVEFGLYVIGCDPAEGNPNSDDSALTVMDAKTGEEVAVLAGKFEPDTFGDYIAQVSKYYNDAPAMVERNNHGHAVISWMRAHTRVRLLTGADGKTGWLTSTLGKALLYTEVANHFRTCASLEHPEFNTKILHSYSTYKQLASIDGSTLSAPKGQFDDRADSYALANVGRSQVRLQRVTVRQLGVRGRGGTPIRKQGVGIR